MYISREYTHRHTHILSVWTALGCRAPVRSRTPTARRHRGRSSCGALGGRGPKGSFQQTFLLLLDTVSTRGIVKKLRIIVAILGHMVLMIVVATRIKKISNLTMSEKDHNG